MSITVESAAALGASDGVEFAKRNLAALTDPARLQMTQAERDAVGKLWQDKQADDHSARRMELACNGAGVEHLIAYTAARETAFCAEMDAYAERLNALAERFEAENAAMQAKMNRAQRRKAMAEEKKTAKQEPVR